ncbi:MAG: fused MFS/spermidine synthase, partial [Chloroflexi bacterium]|nr:fused MFS/spermidine synthase [Chloroflexota bacterium]
MHLRERLWSPYVIVFLSSGCVMVLELVASRLIAPRVGVSLHTWTSVIGVTLAGTSLGNYLGGRLADRHATLGLLGGLFAAGSLSCLAVLWLNNDLHEFTFSGHVPLMAWVLLYVGGVFITPTIVLGCISPIVIKRSLHSLSQSGSTVGRIYAASVAGSIVGTFATGFWLIRALGTKNTVLALAVLLLSLALWFLTEAPWRRAAVRAAICLGLFGGGIALLHGQGFLARECLQETDYYCINVNEIEIGKRPVRELLLDRLVHSYTDLQDPTHLVYDYERTYAGILQPLAERKPDLAVFFIGGGGYTFPRYLEAT